MRPLEIMGRDGRELQMRLEIGKIIVRFSPYGGGASGLDGRGELLVPIMNREMLTCERG